MRYFNLAAVFIYIILCINLINAPSVSAPKVIEAYLGEEKQVNFILQNMDGEHDIKFRAKITKGNEIFSLVDKNTEYLVPVRANNVSVKTLINVPERAKVGEEYNVEIVFKPIPMNLEGGMVQFVVGLSRNLKINIIERPEEIKKPFNLIFLIFSLIGIIILIIIIWVFVKSKREMPATTKK